MKGLADLRRNIALTIAEDGTIFHSAEIVLVIADSDYQIGEGDEIIKRSKCEKAVFHSSAEQLRRLAEAFNRIAGEVEDFERTIGRATVEPDDDAGDEA